MWQCPDCGMTISINPGPKRVICSCKSAGKKGRVRPSNQAQISDLKQQDKPLNMVENNDKLATNIDICEKCPQYMGGHRCKLIDMGCRRTFNRYLRRLDCPLGKWQKTE